MLHYSEMRGWHCSVDPVPSQSTVLRSDVGCPNYLAPINSRSSYRCVMDVLSLSQAVSSLRRARMSMVLIRLEARRKCQEVNHDDASMFWNASKSQAARLRNFCTRD